MQKILTVLKTRTVPANPMRQESRSRPEHLDTRMHPAILVIPSVKETKFPDAADDSDDNDDVNSAVDDTGSGELKSDASGSSGLAPVNERKKLIVDTLDDFGQAALESRVEKKDEIIKSLPKPEEDRDEKITTRTSIATEAESEVESAANTNTVTSTNKVEGSADGAAHHTSLKNLFSAISSSESESKSDSDSESNSASGDEPIVPKNETIKPKTVRSKLVSRLPM